MKIIHERHDHNRLGSRFRINETSQISEHYSVQMKAVMKQKRLVMLGQMYFSIIEYLKHDWPQKAVLQPCYGRNFYLEPTLFWRRFKNHTFNSQQRFTRSTIP